MPPETIYNAVIKNFGLYTAAIIDQPLIERMVKYKFLEPRKTKKWCTLRNVDLPLIS